MRKDETSITMLALLIVVACTGLASAHLPRFVMDDASYISGAFKINNPEISQAFYGELKGKPEFYSIDSDKDFELYMQILSPYPNGDRDFSVVVYKNKTLYSSLYGAESEWKKFYEEYAGDYYWQGPETDKNLSSGKYMLIVYSTNNTGKYSLAVGNIESFPLREALKTLLILPEIKCRFFGKSYFAIFEGKIGRYLALSILAIAVIVFIIVGIIKRLRRNRKHKRRK